MKKAKLAAYIVVFVIIVVHLVLFIHLYRSHGNTSVNVNETTENNTKSVEDSPLQQPEIPPDPTQAALPAHAELPPYTPNFFTIATAPLTPTLQKLSMNCASGLAADLDTRRVFWAKDPDTPRPMASVTKMMTAYLAVKKMKLSNDKITLDTPIKVTREAAGIGGREVWLDPRETFTFNEILKCVMVHSANDCAYLLAQFMGGTEQAFVADMNKEAAAMGCTHLHYINSHGLTIDGKENSGTPAELAYLAMRLLQVPEITKWSSVKLEYLRENDQAFLKRNKGQATMLSNSNSLLGTCQGVNGMKTGFTNKAGFCIVATCNRNNRNAVIVLMGCQNKKDRDKLARTLFDWLYAIP